MIKLSELITSLATQPVPQGSWSIGGVDVEAFEQHLRAASQTQLQLQPYNQANIAHLDGLMLVEALSTHENPIELLQQITKQLKLSSTLIIIDWQADGTLAYGPDFDVRFKKGRLRRLLREWGFGHVETLENHPVYYIIRAVKGPPLVVDQADEFVEVAHLVELPRNSLKKAEIFGHKIVIANTGREIVAFAQACPHADGPLDIGLLRRHNIACPLHGYIWNVSTGEPVFPDDEDCLRRYKVKIDQEQQKIMVSLASPTEDLVTD